MQRAIHEQCKIELGAKALFEITEKAKYGYQDKDKGFKGTGAEKHS